MRAELAGGVTAGLFLLLLALVAGALLLRRAPRLRYAGGAAASGARGRRWGRGADLQGGGGPGSRVSGSWGGASGTRGGTAGPIRPGVEAQVAGTGPQGGVSGRVRGGRRPGDAAVAEGQVPGGVRSRHCKSSCKGSRASLFSRWSRRDEAAPAPVVDPLGFSNPVFDVAGSAEPVRGRVGVSVCPGAVLGANAP